ncbi:MAG: hemerythrin domain-containing protein [Gemmatimonas sp.]
MPFPKAFPSGALRVPTRRAFLTRVGLTGAGAGLLLATTRCSKDEDGEDVGAVEGLMREHGVLRRALLVYSESAARLRGGDATLDLSALNAAANLFRSFGEDYHERQLEEAYIFPALRKSGGDAADLADVLEAQHARGREITDYILRITAGTLSGNDDQTLADVFDGFVAMYENHAAREDTVVFPAWKATLSKRQLADLGDTFEEIERNTFGKDGFDDAVSKIDDIEGALGFADLDSFTAPAPPQA